MQVPCDVCEGAREWPCKTSSQREPQRERVWRGLLYQQAPARCLNIDLTILRRSTHARHHAGPARGLPRLAEQEQERLQAAYAHDGRHGNELSASMRATTRHHHHYPGLQQQRRREQERLARQQQQQQTRTATSFQSVRQTGTWRSSRGLGKDKGEGGHLRIFSATFTTGVATGESLASAASGGYRGIKSHTNGRCVRVGQVLNACANNISAHWSWIHFGYSGMITHFV